MSAYQRTQIYLEKIQLFRLKTFARKQKKSISDLIREAIDKNFGFSKTPQTNWREDSFQRLIGKGSAKKTNLSQEIDLQLYGLDRKKR